MLRGDGKECWTPECRRVGQFLMQLTLKLEDQRLASHHVFARGITRSARCLLQDYSALRDTLSRDAH
jgi:hypothetical protein